MVRAALPSLGGGASAPLGPVAPAPPAHGGGGRAGGGGPLSSCLFQQRVRAAQPGNARTVVANWRAAQPRPPRCSGASVPFGPAAPALPAVGAVRSATAARAAPASANDFTWGEYSFRHGRPFQKMACTKPASKNAERRVTCAGKLTVWPKNH